jgi:hypothetical protein
MLFSRGFERNAVNNIDRLISCILDRLRDLRDRVKNDPKSLCWPVLRQILIWLLRTHGCWLCEVIASCLDGLW